MSQVNHINLVPVLTIINSSRKSSNFFKQISSKTIRKRFVDYFVNEHDHKYVKSSPVIPYCDPSVPFVNAGMNQFKGILLGTQEPKYKRVANYQKCIRVGGKHNDLNIVGTDGFHHTFFEMLGNWSFGDYFKPEACKLAWELLTQVYKLPKKRLYVTYFRGDEILGLEEDIETKEIWMSLGVSKDRILPFGLGHNFWEMGLVGPCGPCTEIHFDHLGYHNRAEFVNKGLHDLIEIWNLVFIQYNRIADGSITKLSKHHVDTGMGFERMTSVLQGKISNYETDIFKYLMDAINENCRGVPKYKSLFGEKDWNDLNASYRMMADHSRMITFALADGIIPEENHKLRKIMRKVFILSETVFKKESGLLRELTNYIVENLESVYPELEKNLVRIQQIIDFEEEIYKNLRKSAEKYWQRCIKENPKLLELDVIEIHNFANAYRDVTASSLKEIDGKTAFRLYDTHGLDEENIAKLAAGLDLKFDPESFKTEMEKVKLNSKKNAFSQNSDIYSYLTYSGVPKTQDKFKYHYKKLDECGYLFEPLQTRIYKIFKYSQSVEGVGDKEECSLLLNKTNLYSEAGGQMSDRGKIYFNNGVFDIKNVVNVNGYVLHQGVYKSNGLAINDMLKCHSVGKIEVDLTSRLNCMRNHTAVHLLNAALRKIKTATCQKSSKVTDRWLSFDAAVFGNKLTKEEIAKIENDVVEVVKKGVPVGVFEIDSQDLLELRNVTLIPGEIYPENGIRLVEIDHEDLLSREPCCGTHVLNTADIGDFCLVNKKSLGRSTTSLTAVTGERARIAKQNGVQFSEQVESFAKHVDDNMDKYPALHKVLDGLVKRLKSTEEHLVLPLVDKMKCTEILDEANKKIQCAESESLNDFIEIEMKNALDTEIKTTKNNKKYLVHYLRSSMMLEKVPLQKATKLCPDCPVLVIAYADSTVQARCCVPQNFTTEEFNAEKWLNETVASVFGSQATPSKNQDVALVCNMKAKRVHVQEWDPLLKASIEKAQEYIEKHL